MKKKYVYIFMQLFTSICLVSVGFASWTFVSGDSITATGNIYAEDVYEATNYIELTNQSKLRYYKTGFVTSENTVSKKGSISVEYTLDIINCKNIYPIENYNTLKVVLYLDSNLYNIFEDTTVSFDIVDGEEKVLDSNNSLIVNDNKHCLEFKITDVLSEDYTYVEYSFIVTYYFTVDDYSIYETKIYPNLSKIELVSSALISGEYYEE